MLTVNQGPQVLIILYSFKKSEILGSGILICKNPHRIITIGQGNVLLLNVTRYDDLCQLHRFLDLIDGARRACTCIDSFGVNLLLLSTRMQLTDQRELQRVVSLIVVNHVCRMIAAVLLVIDFVVHFARGTLRSNLVEVLKQNLQMQLFGDTLSRIQTALIRYVI